jgi:hypothetical protein
MNAETKARKVARMLQPTASKWHSGKSEIQFDPESEIQPDPDACTDLCAHGRQRLAKTKRIGV